MKIMKKLTIVHVDHDPTIHHVSSNEHGEASASRNNQDGKSMMHKVIHMKMVLPMVMSKHDLNSTIKKEVKTTLHKTMVLILKSIKTMMMKMMAPSK